MDAVKNNMEQVLVLLRQDLNTLHAGRASSSLIEKLVVEAYDTKMPLMELATISTPEANQLAVSPFDPGILKNIVRALSLHQELHLSPQIDENNVIRLVLPPLTAERREELVKILRRKLESARIMIRQVRADKMHQIKAESENKTLNQDEKKKAESDVQKLTDDYNQKIGEMGKAKETELLSL
ncbi:MAG: ribosome recycling factor [Candidatus Shapirobacteria bacterium]